MFSKFKLHEQGASKQEAEEEEEEEKKKKTKKMKQLHAASRTHSKRQNTIAKART